MSSPSVALFKNVFDTAAPENVPLDDTRSALDDLAALVGPAVFLRIPYGTKAPGPGWNKTRLEDMTPGYLATFKGSCNVGIRVGQASRGLCSIDCDDADSAAEFLAHNPHLAETLRTTGARGANFWVRIEGVFPPLKDITHRTAKSAEGEPIKLGEWRADGGQTVIHGRHPSGVDYRRIVDAPPIEIAFAKIVWPPDWVAPTLTPEPDAAAKSLEDKFGPAFFTNAKGVITALGEPFWAGLFASENTVLHEPDEKQFYLYRPETGIFEIESPSVITTKIAARILKSAREDGETGLERLRTARGIASIVAHLRGIVEERGAFAHAQHCVHLANGILIFRDGDADLVPFSPEYRSRNRSPIAFDPNARCDRFLEELVRPAVDPEDVGLLQKFFGMSLLGYNRAQRLLVLDGLAGRGKSQLVNVVREIVGPANITQLRTEHLAERFELYRFLGKTLLTGVDVAADFLSTKGAATLKGVVGGDWFDCEQKGGTGSFPMQGQFNVLITSNTRLRVRLQGDVGAWRRRVTIIRFESPPPKKVIPRFAELLVTEEGPGILNWALEGAARVLEEIPDEGGDFQLTQRQRGIVDSLLAESDSLRHFAEARIARDDGGDLAVSEIVDSYAAYCPEMGWRPLTTPEIQSQLESLMLELFGVSKCHDLERGGKRSVRGFRRVRLKREGEWL